jgi:hypothetical protein
MAEFDIINRIIYNLYFAYLLFIYLYIVVILKFILFIFTNMYAMLRKATIRVIPLCTYMCI